MSRRDRNLQDQDLTPREKKVFSIIAAVCGLLILLVIVITIINSNDRITIGDEFGIDKDNVYQYINVEELEEKKNSNEKFHVVLGRTTTSKISSFLELTNKDAKKLKVDKIYILKLDGFNSNELRSVASIIDEKYDEVFVSGSKFLPSLVYFDGGEAKEKSGLGNYDNFTSAIKQYFINCGYTYTEE